MAAAIVAEMVRFYAWPLDRMYTQQNKMASLRSLFVVCACVVAAIIQDQGTRTGIDLWYWYVVMPSWYNIDSLASVLGILKSMIR